MSISSVECGRKGTEPQGKSLPCALASERDFARLSLDARTLSALCTLWGSPASLWRTLPLGGIDVYRGGHGLSESRHRMTTVLHNVSVTGFLSYTAR